MPLTPPIFVCADDVYIFRSKEEAESFIEPVDVEPDERGYDAEGRLLHLLVHGEVKRARWSVDQHRARVELVLAEEAPSHRDELRVLLSDWLRRAGDATPGLAAATLDELVARAARYSPTRAGQTFKKTVWLGIAVLAVGFAVWRWLIR